MKTAGQFSSVLSSVSWVKLVLCNRPSLEWREDKSRKQPGIWGLVDSDWTRSGHQPTVQALETLEQSSSRQRSRYKEIGVILESVLVEWALDISTGHHRGYLSVDWSLNPCGQWHQQGWSGEWPAQQSGGASGASGNWDNHPKRAPSCVCSLVRGQSCQHGYVEVCHLAPVTGKLNAL